MTPPKKKSPPVKRAAGIALARDNILSITEALLDPLLAVIALWIVAIVQEGSLQPIYLILSLIIFSLTFPSSSKITLSNFKAVRNILIAWIILASLLILFGLTTRYIYLFRSNTVIMWLLVTPILQIIGALSLKAFAPFIIKLQGPVKRAVIAGVNEQGLALAARLEDKNYSATELVGYFEDRNLDRLPEDVSNQVLGKLEDLAPYVKSNQISVIYLSLPMASQPRILKLLDDLKDTTASIYFIPDIFMTDLIQSRVDQIEDIPVVAVCETPFTGFNGLIKRTADLVFSIAILILISPILLIIAIGVKLSSPGPIIFKQRRYGLDGQEILVYKFRSMTVTEDGSKVTQATKNDQRITKFGGFLRKSSLDELPQFINVIQGRMSVVGPRPHAVSHNEMYRKLIKGYMIRHKVKPGITGWAQVNGLRGETETLDKMKARIDYDIEYLRNWSPKLDIYIVLKTAMVVFTGEKNAY